MRVARPKREPIYREYCTCIVALVCVRLPLAFVAIYFEGRALSEWSKL